MELIALLNAVILGIIEGLTEFLPVSSTGHLILAGELLGYTGAASATFKIVIQLGAICAVLFVYWRRFLDVAINLPRDPNAQRFTRNLLLGFLPAMVIGVVVYKAIKALLETPMVVAVALIVGGVAILLIERGARHIKVQSVEAMPARTALTIGFAQCLAMIPGVSRSGATIMGALMLGVERRVAAEFTFFLAVPTMAAATVYDLWKSRHLLDLQDGLLIAVGFGTAFLTALLVVRSLIAFVGRYGFAPFAWYRIALGGTALVWLLLR